MTHTDETGGGASRTTDPAAGTSAATDVSLLEYVIALRSGDWRTWKAVAFGVCAFGAFAWSEIQRRLEILNHENARLLVQQQSTVSQDTYKANESQRKEALDDLSEWRKSVDKTLTQSVSREELSRETRDDHRAGISTTTAMIGAVIAALVLGLSVLNYTALHNNKPITQTQTVTVPVTIPTNTTTTP